MVLFFFMELKYIFCPQHGTIGIKNNIHEQSEN